MHKLSYKTLFTIFFFLLIGIVILSRFVLPNKKVSANWWNDSWRYRKAINIDNTSGSNLTDFQVSVSIGTSALIASGKMQSDCDDIRFTDINGNILPFWIDPDMGCNTTTDTIVYTNISEIPSTNGIIYIYYGNPSAPNVQNGSQVFSQLFDTFDGTTLDNNKYNFGGGTITQNNFVSMVNNADGWDNYFYNNNIYTRNPSMVFQAKFKADSGTRSMIGWHDSGSGVSYTDLVYALYFDAGTFRIYEDGSNPAANVGSYTPGTWYDIKIELKATGAKYYYKAITTNTWTQLYDSSYSSESNLRPGIAHYDVTESSNTDNWIIRKYASADPTPTLQSEELSPAPIAYWKFDEGVGTTTNDSTNNSNNGTITGATWANEDQCIFGKCLNFNGSGSPNITIPTSNSLNFETNNFTISAWALNRDYTYPKSNFMIKKSAACISDGGSNSGFDIGHGYLTYGVDICLRDTSNNYIRSSLVFDNGFQPSQLINKWTHYTFIFNRTTGRILGYINGVKQSNELNISSVTGSITSSSGLTIGTLYGWQTDGLYDEIKIYPYARTAEQIKQDYNSRGSSKGSSVNLGIKSSTAPSLKSKLVGYWKFDEGSGTIINNSGSVGSSLNGTFGTGNSAPIWSNNGKFSKSLSINAPQNAKVNTTASLNYTQEGFTYSAWIKPSSFNSAYNMFMGQMLPYFNVYNSGGSDNRLHMSMNAGGGQQSVFGDTHSITTNQWYYVAATYDSQGYMKVYLNGKLDGTAGPYMVPYNYGNDLYFGTWEGAGSYPFNGLIDEVKIYNTALTAEEIKQDYNQGSATTFGTTNQTIGGTTTSLEYCIPGDTSACSPPIAEWNFEENTGTVAKDISGNNNTGTFGTGNSAPTWTVGKKNIGAGLNFNGSTNYIQTPVTGTFNQITFSFWGFFDDSTLNTYSRNESAFGDWNSNRIHFGTRWSVGMHWNVNGLWTEIPNTNLVYGWNHYELVYNTNTNEKLVYINGKLSKSDATNGDIIIGDLKIGNATVLNSYYRGKIDNFKIYNYARTPAQVAYDYNKGAPIGWWKLDECQGLTAFDSSGLGNTGAIVIGAGGAQTTVGTCQIGTSAAWTAGASGKINSSLNFDGTDDYINAGSGTAILPNIYSISGWVKFNSATDAPLLLFGGGNGVYASWGNGKPLIFNNNVNYRYFNTSINTRDGNWHHMIFIVTGMGINDIDNSKCYIDGKEATGESPTKSGLPTTRIGPVWIGGGNNYFNGQIDDVRIYNYALTSEQVKTVYNNGAVNFR